MIKDNEIIFKNMRIEELIEKSRQEMAQYNTPVSKAGRIVEVKTPQEQGRSENPDFRPFGCISALENLAYPPGNLRFSALNCSPIRSKLHPLGFGKTF